MTEDTKKEFAKLVMNMSLISYIGLNELSYKAVSEKIIGDGLIKIKESEKPNIAVYMKNLAPLIKLEMTSGNYYVDVLELKLLLENVFFEFEEVLFRQKESSTEQFELREIEQLKEDINRLEENASVNENIIISLQDELKEKNVEIKKLEEMIESIQSHKEKQETAVVNIPPENIEKDIKTNKTIKTNLDKEELKKAINQLISTPIIVSDIEVYNAQNEQIILKSDEKRCIFDEAKTEYTNENLKKYRAKNLLNFIKKMEKESLQGRKIQIQKLINSDCSNEEKYLRYVLISPNLPRNYIKTIDGAADLGLDAVTVIELLEESDSNFNPEIFEYFVSRIHKGNEFNHKKEFAKELVSGDWYVKANVNGEEERLQLVPFNKIKAIKNELLMLINED